MKQFKNIIHNSKKLLATYLNKSKKQFYFILYDEVVHAYSIHNSKINFLNEFTLKDLDANLKNLLQNKQISKNGNYYVFFNNYPIEHIEKPNLTKEELFNFIQFKLADYVSYPVEDATYDIISNGEEESNYFKKYLTAFIVNKTEVNFISNSFKKYNLNLVAIDNTITGLRDFIGSYNEEVTPNNSSQSTAYIKICDKKAFITIYQNYGIVLSRSFNLRTQILETRQFIENNKHLFIVDDKFSLENNISLLEMSPINDISDKISLELHRVTDYLDRQYSIAPFHKIIYVHNNDPIFKILESKVYSSFNLEKPSDESLAKTLHNISYSNSLEFEVAALSLRGFITKENINLNQKIINGNQLFVDLKKMLALCSVVGLLFTCIGSYFFIQNKQQIELNNNLSTKVKSAEEQLATLTKSINLNDVTKEISELETSKNNLLLLNPLKNQNQKILFDLSSSAKENNVYLESIVIDNDKWKIMGVSLSKEKIIKFLNSLSSDKSFEKANLQNIHIFPAKESSDSLFSFTLEGNIKEIAIKKNEAK